MNPAVDPIDKNTQRDRLPTLFLAATLFTGSIILLTTTSSIRARLTSLGAGICEAAKTTCTVILGLISVMLFLPLLFVVLNVATGVTKSPTFKYFSSFVNLQTIALVYVSLILIAYLVLHLLLVSCESNSVSIDPLTWATISTTVLLCFGLLTFRYRRDLIESQLIEARDKQEYQARNTFLAQAGRQVVNVFDSATSGFLEGVGVEPTQINIKNAAKNLGSVISKLNEFI